MLEGEKVVLRAVEAADAERVQRWVNQALVAPWVAAVPGAVSRRAVETWLTLAGTGRDGGGRTFAVETRDGRHIGLVELHDIDWPHRRCRIRLLIGEPDFQGRGYEEDVLRAALRFAFAVLNLNRVEVRLPATAERLLQAYRAAGFVEEGRSAQAFFQAGQYVDGVNLAALAGPWLAGAPAL